MGIAPAAPIVAGAPMGPDYAGASACGPDGCATAPGCGVACPDPIRWGAGGRFYGSAEYILWKIKDQALPPSQLSSPFTVTGISSFQSNLTFPNGVGVDYGGRSGGRFTAGYYVHPDEILGFEATYFQLENANTNIFANQVANLPTNVTVIQNITMPSTVQTTISQVPLNVTLPGQLTVLANGAAGPRNFWGAEINARSTRCYYGGVKFDVIGGFRYLEFGEGFSLNESIRLQVANPINLSGPGPIPPNPLPPIPPPITGLRDLFTIRTSDTITTRNQFYGGQVGGSFDWAFTERLALTGWGKIGAGAMIQTINIVGNTVGANGAIVPGGILTPANGFINNSTTRYAIVPEFNFALAYAWTSHIRTTIGYNLLYLTTVARPGDQIGFSSSSTTINISGQPVQTTVNQPAFNYRNTDIWAQGLTAGFEFRY